MSGTSTLKALYEASCKCLPSDTQVWTLENSNVGFTASGNFTLTNTGTTIHFDDASVATPGGIPLICCAFPASASSTVECAPQQFQTPISFTNPSGNTSATNPILVNNNQSVSGTVLCYSDFDLGIPDTVTTPTTSVIVNSPYVAFSNYACGKRCWTQHTIADIGAAAPTGPVSPPTTNGGPVSRPCRVYLTAGSWTPFAVSSVSTLGSPNTGSVIVGTPSFPNQLTGTSGTILSLTANPVRVEILKGLDAIVNSFISCSPICPSGTSGFTSIPASIPDLLVDTSILVYAFNKGGYCGHYTDSNGNVINSACQFVNAVLCGEDLQFSSVVSPENTGTCGCLCTNENSVTINLCNFPCLASRLICAEKAKWVFDAYIACHRPRKCCDCCSVGTV